MALKNRLKFFSIVASVLLLTKVFSVSALALDCAACNCSPGWYGWTMCWGTVGPSYPATCSCSSPGPATCSGAVSITSVSYSCNADNTATLYWTTDSNINSAGGFALGLNYLPDGRGDGVYDLGVAGNGAYRLPDGTARSWTTGTLGPWPVSGWPAQYDFDVRSFDGCLGTPLNVQSVRFSCLPFTCSTGTFYGACQYSGLNWCAAGTSCTTGVVSGPSTYVSCPVGTRIVNQGTYCNNTDYSQQSYSGSTSCQLDYACPQPPTSIPLPTNTPVCSLPASSPNSINPCGSISAGAQTVNWSSVGDATSYYVRIDDVADGYCIGGSDYCPGAFASTSTVYNFQAGHTYNLSVYANNSCGYNPTPVSCTVTVPLPPTPTVCSLPSSPGNLQPNGIVNSFNGLSWSASSNTSVYQIRVDSSPNSWSNNCAAPNAGDLCASTNTNSLSTSSFYPQPGVWYGWWLHAQNACDLNYWNASAGTNFCLETQSCNGLACGQTLPCGQYCGNGDLVTPGVVSLVSPVGSLASPVSQNGSSVILSWVNNETNHVYTDHYNWVVQSASNGAQVTAGSTADNATNSVNLNSTNFTNGVVYRWSVSAENLTCSAFGQTLISNNSAWGYFKFNSPPTVSNIVPLANYNNTTVNVDPVGGGNTNQICQTEFMNGNNQTRRLRWTVTATDADGANNIDNVSLRMINGGSPILTLTSSQGGFSASGSGSAYVNLNASSSRSVNGNNVVVVFDVTFANNFPRATYSMDLYTDDIDGGNSGYINVDRTMRIWNCLVGIRGTIYDSSGVAGVNCPTGNGYAAPAYGNTDFSSFSYTSAAGNVAMNVTGNATYDSGSNYLTWGVGYTPQFPTLDAFPPTNQLIRVTSLATGMVRCVNTLIGVGYTSGSAMATDNSIAYQDNPTIQADFTTTVFFDGWYQSSGGGVIASNRVQNPIPVTCPLNMSCTASTTIPNGNSDNGLVAASNLSGIESCTSCNYGTPNNWFSSADTVNSEISYTNLFNKIKAMQNVGIALTGNNNFSSVVNAAASNKGIAFVEGNLNIDTTNNLGNGFLMIVVKGDINVNANVPTVAGGSINGIFVTDGSFRVDGTNANQLVINGSIYAKNNIILTRGYTPRSINNTSPAVVVAQNPALLFRIPSELRYTEAGWKEGTR